MSSTIAQSIELPLGYTVVDRLGAGGYGEVWKATAPGGVEKAIKIVFGHCDEGMAERELKSLERIKSVRHPFVLTIERYEIVNNRLVIVTELADMSLSDCFQNCLSAGHSGIPREQLIAYLWDAAEALDCLVEQHSLQHLDIKPENLLVVGDHIKVADFGLVKELASKTLNSMMGGMTPLYSAPEIYDNNPSSRSDQYSLAIVYQQMLTGSLPFSGRTPAQLAKQHTLAEPCLNQLSEADRLIVRKALEKDPAARFGNCREFVTALQSVGQARPGSTIRSSDNKGAQSSNQIENEDTKSVASIDTKHLEDPVDTAATQVLSDVKSSVDLSASTAGKKLALEPRRAFPHVESTIEDVEVPDFDCSAPSITVPTLFVGVGGVGIKMLRAIRSRARAHETDDGVARAWLAIDTERETLKDSIDAENYESFSSDEKLHISLRRPNQYREESQALLQWVSRRWLYNIPRSLQTRGFRPLGRIAVVDHADAIFSTLQKRLYWLATKNHSLAENPGPIRVVLLAGMSGGTGSGTVIDIAQAVRSVCLELSQELIVNGVFGSTFYPESTDSLAAANMYSFLTELSHTQLIGNCGDSPPPGPALHYELPRRAFNEVYTVSIPTRSDRTACDLTLQSIADYLLLEANHKIGPGIDAIRSIQGQQAQLRTFSCVNIRQLANESLSLLQQNLVRAIVASWLDQGSEGIDTDAKHFCQHSNSRFAHAILSHLPDISPNAIASDSVTANQKSIRMARVKRIATAFLQFIDSFEVPHNNGPLPIDSADVISASNRIVAKVCMILESSELQENDLARTLSELLAEQVSESTEKSSTISPDELAVSALSLFEAGPLNCGYRRRTMLITSSDQHNLEFLEAFKEACPTLATYKTAVSETYLVREGSELHPLHLGARLAEIYPDIDEAASRLYTRSDIQWLDLRDL